MVSLERGCLCVSRSFGTHHSSLRCCGSHTQFCCEIDEACQSVSPYIRDMDNCLTWAGQLHRELRNVPRLYWSEVGATKRIQYITNLDDQEKSKQQQMSMS